MATNQVQRATSTTIDRHYDRNDIEAEIQKIVERAGLALTDLTPSDLSTFDELHIGGKQATRSLAEKSGLEPGSLVLDVGSGLGGPARTLASEFGHTVIGVDITERFCKTSRRLTTIANLSEHVDFICGDALKFPFKSNTFDGIWSQHCSMNIQDKDRLYSEFHRVLKVGGRLLIHDVVAGNGSPIHFPVPWAADPSISFLVDESAMVLQLTAAGFVEGQRLDITTEALSWFRQQRVRKDGAPRPLFNQKIVYGDELPTLVRNMVTNLQEGRMRIVEAVLRKSGQP